MHQVVKAASYSYIILDTYIRMCTAIIPSIMYYSVMYIYSKKLIRCSLLQHSHIRSLFHCCAPVALLCVDTYN